MKQGVCHITDRKLADYLFIHPRWAHGLLSFTPTPNDGSHFLFLLERRMTCRVAPLLCEFGKRGRVGKWLEILIYNLLKISLDQEDRLENWEKRFDMVWLGGCPVKKKQKKKTKKQKDTEISKNKLFERWLLVLKLLVGFSRNMFMFGELFLWTHI